MLRIGLENDMEIIKGLRHCDVVGRVDTMDYPGRDHIFNVLLRALFILGTYHRLPWLYYALCKFNKVRIQVK